MLLPLLLALAAPAEWVPARWNSTDPSTLDLAARTPVNCLLVGSPDAVFAARAAERGIATLLVIEPGGDPAALARKAVAANLTGIVLEGDFPEDTAARVRDSLAGSKAVLIELPPRVRMKLDSPGPVIGTCQGVWPGIQVLAGGAHKAAPTGSPWIDTNSGFIRAVRAWSDAAVWIGNRPPPRTVVTAQRYLQVISDAAMAGARWVIALDDDLHRRLMARDGEAVKTWESLGRHLKYYEEHRELRSYLPYSRLALIQDPADGGMLSGGIIDMLAARHIPLRSLPRQQLKGDALKGASMAINVDPSALTPEQRELVRAFTRGGGTLLNGPPGWKFTSDPERITLAENEVERLTDIWRDVNFMVGRRNLGARLFNVSGMLSTLLAGPEGKPLLIHLVNYTGYPVESVTVHLPGEFHRARLFAPEGGERSLEVYKTEDGSGIDLDRISVCATLKID